MKLGKGVRLLIGLLTLSPLVYTAFFIVFIFSPILGHFWSDSPSHPVDFRWILPIHLLMMLVMIGLLAFYITFVFKSDRVAADKKALWALVLFLGNGIAMPVFFYLYLWKDPEPPGKAEAGA